MGATLPICPHTLWIQWFNHCLEPWYSLLSRNSWMSRVNTMTTGFLDINVLEQMNSILTPQRFFNIYKESGVWWNYRQVRLACVSLVHSWQMSWLDQLREAMFSATDVSIWDGQSLLFGIVIVYLSNQSLLALIYYSANQPLIHMRWYFWFEQLSKLSSTQRAIKLSFIICKLFLDCTSVP